MQIAGTIITRLIGINLYFSEQLKIQLRDDLDFAHAAPSSGEIFCHFCFNKNIYTLLFTLHNILQYLLFDQCWSSSGLVHNRSFLFVSN